MHDPHSHGPDPDPDGWAAGDLDPWNADELEDDPEDDLELGTPVYEGTGLSVRALTAKELDRFLAAHADQPAELLGSGWDALQPSAPQPTGASLPGSPDPLGPAALGWPGSRPAGPRLAPRGGYGSPGRSALQRYRQERAAELAGWARTGGWRAAAVIAAGVLAGVLVQAAGLDRLALPVGLAGAIAAGWRLRFRVSRNTHAWRDGARGERATARMLRQRHRHGWAELTPFHMAFLRAASSPGPGGKAGGTPTQRSGAGSRAVSSALLRALAFDGGQQTGSNRRS
jgi:hypothetical protein